MDTQVKGKKNSECFHDSNREDDEGDDVRGAHEGGMGAAHGACVSGQEGAM